MHPLLWFFGACVVGLLLSAIVFHVLARMGKFGNAICDACTKGYLLDLTVFYFTHGPWIAAGVVWWKVFAEKYGALTAPVTVTLTTPALAR